MNNYRNLMERKYPAGTRVKLIQPRGCDWPAFTSRYPEMKQNARGTVTGVNEFGTIDVAWDDDPELEYDLIPLSDRFSRVFNENEEKKAGMMRVICSSPRELGHRLIVGGIYYVDPQSVWGDSDNNMYGEVYDTNLRMVGMLNLNHFQTKG